MHKHTHNITQYYTQYYKGESRNNITQYLHRILHTFCIQFTYTLHSTEFFIAKLKECKKESESTFEFEPDGSVLKSLYVNKVLTTFTLHNYPLPPP